MPSFDLPPDHRPYTDTYFLRAKRILEADDLNPRVTYQVFIRKGPGLVSGMDEAVAILAKYAHIHGHDQGTHVYALPEGNEFQPGDSLMHIEAPIQQIVELETMYLGVISAATTMNNAHGLDLQAVRDRGRAIRDLCPDKQLIYFGARHWHWSMDPEISRILVEECGWNACSTDAGAHGAGLDKGVGTIPHALVLTYAHSHGVARATVEATLAFDRHMEPEAKRIALVDTFNREIDDTLATARAMPGRLHGVRLDTAGELVAQGSPAQGERYWAGKGVTVEGTAAVRSALDEAGFEKVNITLSSGFGKLDKLRAFVEGERKHGRLFEALGIGGVFDSWHATSDIVRIEGREMSKTGRGYLPNPNMRRVL
ncbi:nicotinate phosphoribosyltransferase [Desulfocurvibacter africanus]|uniref:nicotinate phosphoribosyltransferase n=1 Tax=Desulfocurvibacter africanus TaxID=873 RepID=UPI00041DDDB5|nr:nicotinate phosphoribosyltransferase [Desulfocurvibacter africanus]